MTNEIEPRSAYVPLSKEDLDALNARVNEMQAQLTAYRDAFGIVEKPAARMVYEVVEDHANYWLGHLDEHKALVETHEDAFGAILDRLTALESRVSRINDLLASRGTVPSNVVPPMGPAGDLGGALP